MADYHINALNEALSRLRESPSLAAAVQYLAARVDAINTELHKTVVAEIPAFSESRYPDILPELSRHGPEHSHEILRLLGGGLVGDFEFVREHAKRRAEQRFPLEATLHAYRCGHKVFLRWMRKATLASAPSPADAQQIAAAIADFTIEYTDAISTTAAGSYASHTGLMADVAGDQRAQLLNILLEGYDEADGRAAKILRNAGYLERRQVYCVAIAQAIDPAEMINPARARRLADAIGEVMRKVRVRQVIDLHNNKVVVVMADIARASGWSAPRSELTNRAATALTLVGPAAIIGISNDAPSTSRISSAYQEALLALEFADVSRRVLRFCDIPVLRLLSHLAGEDFRRTLPPWTWEFIAADDKAGGVMTATIQAYADTNMNVLKAAEALGVHPNTLYARLQKIFDVTGLDAKSYHALTELLIVVECAQQIPSRATL